MQSEFWLERWAQDQTGWHRDEVHSNLIDHQARVLDGAQQILVPLCGKTRDVAWLAQHRDVLAVEFSPIAAAQLFEEAGLTPTQCAHGPFVKWTAGRITVLVGDFFALTPEWAGPVDRVWDRAAMVAIDPTRRDEYAAVLRAVAPAGSVLLNALNYDQTVSPGPPWCLSPDQIAQLFPTHELLAEQDVLDDRWRERGHRFFHTQLYAVSLQ